MVEATLFTLIILLLTGAIWKTRKLFCFPFESTAVGTNSKKHADWLAVILKHIMLVIWTKFSARLKQCKL
jgi:hypothetical protein